MGFQELNARTIKAINGSLGASLASTGEATSRDSQSGFGDARAVVASGGGSVEKGLEG